MIPKEDLIKYILEKDPNHQRPYLEGLNLETLVTLKVQIELALHRKETLMPNKKKDVIRKKN